ncbi:MAG: glycosyltransferase family 4 protein [Candidatus Omnitrophota bacterium]|nr:glycosyltransferase family 4 protein [Candidatus Omnitrophota bacterium]
MKENRFKLCIFLTDPMRALYEKGEIKPRYYNPGNLFTEVHMISFCDKDIATEKIQIVVGNARLFLHRLGKLNLFNILFVIKKIIVLLKEIKPNIIRAYDISVRGALACYCAKALNIPCVLSIHVNFDEQRRYDRRFVLQLRKIFERYALARSDMVICVSNYLKEYVKQRGVKKTRVIYNRVNLNQFSDLLRKRQFVGLPHLLSVGRLVSQKNHECIIRAIKDLNVKLTLIGSGNLSNYLKKLVRKLGIEDRVEFIEAVPHSVINEYYRKADIFVLASHYEGFCIPIIEAMASGLPIVASNLPAIAEIVDDCGLLCKNEPADFREKIETLLKNSELRSNLSQKARERSRFFDYEILEKQEAEIYKNLIFNAK